MTLALRVALLVVVSIAVAAAEPVGTAVQLDGIYLSTGTNPDGGEFYGFVQIERHSDSFRVTWLMAQVQDDESVMLVPTGMGIGIVHGGMFAVSFHDSGMDGVGLFNVDDEGRSLAGRWTLAGGDGATYIEVLQRLPEDVTLPLRSDPPDGQPPRWRSPSDGQAIRL